MEEPEVNNTIQAAAGDNKSEVIAEIIDSVAQHANTFHNLTREELVEKLRELLNTRPIAAVKEQIESIKQCFYRKLKAEMEMKLDAAATDNSETAAPDEPDTQSDALEAAFKELMAKYRELKAAENAVVEARQAENLAAKQRILDELAKLIASSDDLSSVIPAFRKLQQDWKAIGQVPATKVTEIWKAYSAYQEQFYDLIKINNDLRDYDFKKNLEQKSALCEQAERLAEREDVIDAFKQLQKLHDDWREIGPVAREQREEIWNRFKAASTAVNKRHQAYFESIKEQEEKFVAEKNALCELVEQIDTDALKSYKQWDDKTQEVIEIQAKWKAIGGIPSYKAAVKAFKRFRNACDKFFKAKKAFYKSAKAEFAKNLEAKKALCEQAEALKDSTDWKATADKMVQLQKEWKQIGAIGKKQSDAVWKRFVAACDYFFEQKAANYSDKYSEEIANLKAKKAIVEKIAAFERTDNKEQDATAIQAFIDEYNKVGFVPYRDKDKLAKAFKAATDKFDDLLHSKRAGKASSERAKLLKEYDRLKAEIATYENNIGFFANSKNTNPLVEQMKQRIEQLKQQFAKVVAQIQALDEA
ncbi:MAG: DUF349 domain-containing protein [Bacteroidales bacterium]|nr:DUF349 domain-containing protein [Bacteroidales bacterium]